MAYALGKYSQAQCDRCGFVYAYQRLKEEWNGLRVCPTCFEEKHPQLEPLRKAADPESLKHPRPTESPATNDVAGIFSDTQTFTVTVVDSGGNKYVIEGSTAPTLTLVRGFTYTFDQSDSTNSNHPLRFKNNSDAYSTGVSSSGTAGSAGATVTFTVPQGAPDSGLRYYCTVHGNSMGNTITVINDQLG